MQLLFVEQYFLSKLELLLSKNKIFIIKITILIIIEIMTTTNQLNFKQYEHDIKRFAVKDI